MLLRMLDKKRILNLMKAYQLDIHGVYQACLSSLSIKLVKLFLFFSSPKHHPLFYTLKTSSTLRRLLTNAPCLKFKEKRIASRTTFKRNSPQKPLFFKTCKVFQTLRNSKSRTIKRDREEKREGIFFFFFFFVFRINIFII